MIPRIAIVGRPNVGKSTLLNRLARRRVSIVHEMAGVTRDRVAVELELDGRNYEVIDTGGIGIVDHPDLQGDIDLQISAAIESSDLILFLVDARSGPQPEDSAIADRLRRESVPVLLVANKCESERAIHGLGEFFELGLGEPQRLSAEHDQGVGELLERIVELLPGEEEGRGDPALKIAIVGRRNAGKSTFINALLDEDRVIVSDLPGTTRDAVDVRFTKDGQEFVVIDTAGMVRRTKLKTSVDYYAQVRAVEAIRRADVAILFIDAIQGVGQLEKRIAREIVDQFRACVIAVNKWDLAKDKLSTEEFEDYLTRAMPGLDFAPIVYVTAKTGRNVADTIGVAQSLAKQSRLRVGTGELNRALEAIAKGHLPRVRKGQYPKIFFATQTGVMPPVLVLFVNQPKFFSPEYRRFIENRFREMLPFQEIPVKILYRKRKSLYHE